MVKMLYTSRRRMSGRGDTIISDLLLKHFGRFEPADLSIAERQFPFRVRADLQRAIEQTIDADSIRHFSGVRSPYAMMEGIEFTGLLARNEPHPAVAVPPQYEDIDIGEDRPVRALKVGFWLMEKGGASYAILLSPAGQRGMGPNGNVRFQVATTNDASGDKIADSFFIAMERAVNDCRSYRGKILSLEQGQNYRGQSTGIRVHKLRTVTREQVVLPQRTMELLDRNVIGFVEKRQKLAKFGHATKKGILFYGPPETGKSHTIHYLASALVGNTTLLITAEQVALLAEYMALARLLQPSVIVIEDVDLIARERSQLYPGQESLLNKLLNEMDGLRESADILFILTTNRPEALEMALTSRPGRVDQAIEFPLPDEAGREKLVRLYGQGMALADDLVSTIVRRTENVSGAFIKELMRRSVQFQLERPSARQIALDDVENALNEMLFSGGSLNVKLLGGNVGTAAKD